MTPSELDTCLHLMLVFMRWSKPGQAVEDDWC